MIVASNAAQMEKMIPKTWGILGFLEAISDVTSGNAKIKQGDYLAEGAYPIVDQGEGMVAGYTNDADDLAAIQYPAIFFGDHTRRFKYVETPVALGADGVKALNTKERVDPKYAFYFMQHVRLPEDAGYSRHYKFLREVFIPIPYPTDRERSLSEQKRIAAILDKADVIRRQRQQAIHKAQSLIPAIFYEMFGDPVTNPHGFRKEPLGLHIKVKSGQFLPAKEMDTSGTHPVYGGNGINGYHSDYLFESPQIVIGRVGVYCGAVHVSKPRSWVTDNALYVSEHSEELLASYLAKALEYADLNQYAGQAAQPLISGSRIYPVEILIPPPDLQGEFSRRIEAIQISEERYDRAYAEANSLFNSLTQRAFKGEL